MNVSCVQALCKEDWDVVFGMERGRDLTHLYYDARAVYDRLMAEPSKVTPTPTLTLTLTLTL
jgi:hypothetical protein